MKNTSKLTKVQECTDFSNCGFHTAQIKTVYLNEDGLTDDPCIKDYSIRTIHEQKFHFLKVNLNESSEGNLNDFTRFVNKMNLIIKFHGIQNPDIVRADFRFDSDDPEHYEQTEKLNRLLISCIMHKNKILNKYQANDLISGNRLSCAVKGKSFEIEHYNRAVKNIVTDNTEETAQSRLEIRSKSRLFAQYSGLDMYYAIYKQFAIEWVKRLNNAVTKKNIDATLEEYNQSLFSQYQVWNSNPTRFIDYNKDRFFTRKQLLAFYKMIGAKNPSQQAYNFSKRYNIEFVSKEMLIEYVGILNQNLVSYFDKWLRQQQSQQVAS